MSRPIRRLVAVMMTLVLVACSVPMFSLSASAASEYPNTHVNTGDMAADIVAVAATQIGYCEGSLSGNPSYASTNNLQKYGQWYDNNVDYIGVQQAAWCAAFVSWCANQAGVPNDIVYYHAYCPYGVNWFRNRGQFQYAASRGGSYVPKAGDIIYFAPAGSSTSSHIGIVRDCDGTNVYTIEGNTSGQNGEVNEGGGVFAKTYSLSYSRIYGYGIPNYVTTPGATAEKLGTYRITASSLNIRESANTSSAILAEVVTNDLVYVTELSNGWGKVTLSDGTQGWCAITQYGEYIGVDALYSDLKAAWGEEYLTMTTNENGSVTFTNANTADQIAVDMPLLLPLGNKTTPSFNISVTPHTGGYYFGITQAGSGYFMMRDCNSGDELVLENTAPYMTGEENLQIDISYWWASEDYQVDTVRLYLGPSASVTVNYCYFAAQADVVTSDAYNMRNGSGVAPDSNPTVSDAKDLMLPDTLAIEDYNKSGSYTYQNGVLTVISEDTNGFEVSFSPNVDFSPEDLNRWLISVDANVRFDIELLVTTLDGERTFSLCDDFYDHFADARDGDYIPAMTGSAGLDLYSCYTWNMVMPAGGISTVKKATVRVGGVGTVVVNEIQVAPNDVLTEFSDSVTKSGSSSGATYEPVNLMLPDTLSIVDRTKTGKYTYQNGVLTIVSQEEGGYEVAFDTNIAFTPEQLNYWIFSVDTSVRFDIELLVTTLDGERTFSLCDDFYAEAARDGDYIPAFSGSAAFDLYSCYTWNNVVPADGVSTIKKVTIRVGGAGTVTVNEIQVACNDVLTVFTDSVEKTDSSPNDSLKGDVDKDGKITTADAREILFMAIDTSSLTAADITVADYNGDGSVTTTDARELLLDIVG